MAELSPLRRRMIEDHDGPQSVSGNPAIVHQRRSEVQPLFRSVTGSA